jgi:hypothetical protein
MLVHVSLSTGRQPHAFGDQGGAVVLVIPACVAASVDAVAQGCSKPCGNLVALLSRQGVAREIAH